MMKLIVNTLRLLVGALLVFSGFVKLVDPVGTGLKLKEYFEVFSADLPALSGFFGFFAANSLILSLLFCAFEVILGIALLFKFKPRLTVMLSLLMMLFFTFLTFYSAQFNKVTDCGCFGDFLKLKPWVSFGKDVILTIILLIIYFGIRHIKAQKTGLLIGIASVICLGIGTHAIYYLPSLDFLPYAEGKSIPEQMKPAEKPKFLFIMEKDGKLHEFNEFPTDTTYKYKESKILNEDAAKAKITDYALTNQNGDIVTDSSFIGTKLLVSIKHVHDVPADQADAISALLKNVKNAGIMVVSSENATAVKDFLKTHQIQANLYSIDEKVQKTIARADPVLVLMKDGIVKGKWSGLEIPTAEELTAKLNP